MLRSDRAGERDGIGPSSRLRSSYDAPGRDNGMEGLRAQDFDDVNEFLRGSYASESGDALTAHALRALQRLVPADAITWNVIHRTRGVLRIDRQPPNAGPDR